MMCVVYIMACLVYSVMCMYVCVCARCLSMILQLGVKALYQTMNSCTPHVYLHCLYDKSDFLP